MVNINGSLCTLYLNNETEKRIILLGVYFSINIMFHQEAAVEMIKIVVITFYFYHVSEATNYKLFW